MRQVTLVALYGQKSEELRDLIIEIQDIIGSHPGVNFQSYDFEQVHGTIVGLERVIDSAMFNMNFSKYNLLVMIAGTTHSQAVERDHTNVPSRSKATRPF